MLETLFFLNGVFDLFVNGLNHISLMADAAWTFRHIVDDVWIAYQAAGPVWRFSVPTGGVAVTLAVLYKALFSKIKEENEEPPKK